MTDHRIGLLGARIGGSLSPALHDAEARAGGLTGYRYERLDLLSLGRSSEEAGCILREAVGEGFTGFNVTFPCKQTVIAGLDRLDPDAEALGAVNTVVVDAVGHLVGHNTDHTGFGEALRSSLPDADLRRVVLVGAGGAGAAVAHALVVAGTGGLVIADVDPSRAADLAESVRRRHPRVDTAPAPIGDLREELAGATGLVNATPIGMDGFPGTPVGTDHLHPGLWVGDVVYRPVRTTLLDAAARIGCSTLDGSRMFVAQAADTFRLVTGIDPDRDRMYRHLGELLTARQAAS